MRTVMIEGREQAAIARTKSRPWDPADYLEDLDDVVAYLEAAFEDGDPRVIAGALGDVARSKGMTAVAAKSGLGRESLYKALSRDGNPGFATVLSVLGALGLRLHPSADRREPVGPVEGIGAGWSGGFALPLTDLYVLSGDSTSCSAARASDYR